MQKMKSVECKSFGMSISEVWVHMHPPLCPRKLSTSFLKSTNGFDQILGWFH